MQQLLQLDTKVLKLHAASAGVHSDKLMSAFVFAYPQTASHANACVF